MPTSTRSLGFSKLTGLALVSFVSLVWMSGCGLLAKKLGAVSEADAEATPVVAEQADAAPPPVVNAVVTPTAANENDVSRFPDEKKLENVLGTLQRVTNVREIPGIGKVVATLAKGGSVTELAQRDKFFLVAFTNPKDQRRLMGWVNQDSFTAPVDAGTAFVKCAAPETALIGDTPFCGKVCTLDSDCANGQACKGAANRLLATGGKGDAVTVCTVVGAPRVSVDASAPPPVVVPAIPVVPATAAEPAASVGVLAPTNGKCPSDFTLVKDNLCHRNCVRIGGCPAASPLCLNCTGPKVCAANRDICK